MITNLGTTIHSLVHNPEQPTSEDLKKAKPSNENHDKVFKFNFARLALRLEHEAENLIVALDNVSVNMKDINQLSEFRCNCSFLNEVLIF